MSATSSELPAQSAVQIESGSIAAIMPSRFQRSRWSFVRIKIDKLTIGQTATFKAKDYSNAKNTVDRMNDAYGGEKVWKIGGGRKTPRVTRIK